MRKSEYNRQIEAKAVKSVAPKPEPYQPLPSVPSESEPEEHPPGNVENIAYAGKGQLLREVEAGIGPWFGMPTAEKRKGGRKEMKGFHLRSSKRTGLVDAPKQQALFPPYTIGKQAECFAAQQHT